MYLALHRTRSGLRFSLRESFLQDGIFQHRELVDLGSDPSKAFVYPGGNSFYVSEAIVDELESLGHPAEQSELEDLLWQFLDPAIRRKLEGFCNRDKHRQPPPPVSPEEEEFIRTRVHLTDKRRYNYLRMGVLDQSKLQKIPIKFYRPLVYKSRDELEQFFISLERELKPTEYSSYVYSFLHLRRFFYETLAGHMPQALDLDRLDQLFESDICTLNNDARFWGLARNEHSLHPYLTRYAIMWFDFPFAESTFMEERRQDFFARSRERFEQARSAKASSMTSQTMSDSFGKPMETLRTMSKRQLTRLYRRLAKQKHPDHGGDHEAFVQLAQAYHELMRKK